MKPHAERLAANAAERAQLDAARLAAHGRARQIRAEADEQHTAAIGDLEAQAAREADEAVADFNRRLDAALTPLVAANHEELTNKVTAALCAAGIELDGVARKQLGEALPIRRVLYLLAEVHRAERPGIVGRLTAPDAWRARDYGPGGVLELGGKLFKAIERRDVAAARLAFEALDALFWGFPPGAVDDEAVVTWEAMIDPNPAVLRARQAELAAREAEARTAATEAGCLAAVRKGWAKIGWQDARGAT